ncbi:MAG: LPS export ABC transporter periplasmic protein LptC [Azonexus sp.]|nr:LPS export ABC transporter periplasmic protein LptC [Betaproteobacteria bacterium]MBK8916939.1 LPS export ABC transporter periplasmic protein LptC [Betaproteobacteria bacterium]MBP6036104.1 LPS export ABC transporter periplasmic protein LptC [Azonexus sp.]MBP6906627.1 LPS export ABC transporter periplasmic protein LptC [Azonexus sp.]
MKRWTGQVYPIVLLSLLAALSYWLQQVLDQPVAPPPDKTRHDPDTVAENFTVRRFDPEGRLRYRLIAPRMLHYGDDDSSLIENPLLVQTRPDAPDMTLAAERAVVAAEGETVFFWGDVVATRAASGDRPEMVARMPDLTVQPDAGTAFTDGPVEITRGQSWTRGVGLSLDNNTSVLVLKSQVTGLLYPSKAPR